METTPETSTCGRYLGMSQEEKTHNAVDDFFGVKTKEEIEQEKLAQEKLLQEKKDYLLTNNIEINNLSTDEISSKYEECKYNNLTDNEKETRSLKLLSASYNTLRIIRGFGPIVYSN